MRLLAPLLLLVPACGQEGMPDGGRADTGALDAREAGVLDARPEDAPGTDAAPGIDGGALDAPFDAVLGPDALDGSLLDGSIFDGALLFDAPIDVGLDAAFDAAFDGGFDGGFDAGFDGGRDAPPAGGCVSGATGTHVARFRWNGSGSGSRAYVSYEANTLPDTTRWRASAASMSIGYTPVYVDTFLAEGGLELSGTVFIDVELSTVGLSAIRNVTIAIYGRSYATTTSGSFTWQTFRGTGATPSGSMANSAPYEWYPGDATSAFTAGDSGVYLRLRAGPPSSSVVVSRVEICFDAS